MDVAVSELYSLLHRKHFPPLYSLWNRLGCVPPQTFLITERLLEQFADRAVVSAEDLLSAVLEDTEDAVEPDFSVTALNSINTLYYGYCVDAFTKYGDIANLFVKNRMVQYTLLNLLLDRVSSPTIRIHEFCCGGRYSRWQYWAQYLPRDRFLDVTLSDISSDIIPLDVICSLRLPRMRFSSLSYDLRTSLPFLFSDARYDVLLVTYGFDSVWLPDDVMYVKYNGHWSKMLYRVKVLPDAPHKNLILPLLRAGYSDTAVPLSFFKFVVVEVIAQPVSLCDVAYGSIIHDLYDQYSEVRLTVPATLVHRVDEGFRYQLRDSGIFIIGEVATYPDSPYDPVALTVVDYHTTGKVGKYKVEDFWLAEKILQSKGYRVEVFDLADAASRYGKVISEDCADTWVMIVSRG